MALTFKEARYVVERSKGLSKVQALTNAGFALGTAQNPKNIETPELLAEIEKYQAEIVKNSLDAGLIDAQEIHEYLSDCLRADVSDILNDDFSYKKLSEWPAVWKRMYEAGDIEVSTEYERSKDGQDGEKRGGWDPASTVTKIKLKFSSRVKMLELAMKHKAVNAMVEAKSGDINVTVIHAQVTAKLQGALARKSKLDEARSVLKP